MIALIIHCPACGKLSSRTVHVQKLVVTADNRTERCGHCGGAAYAAIGTYEDSTHLPENWGDSAQVFVGKLDSLALGQLHSTVQRAAAAGVIDDAVVAAITEISPELGKLAKAAAARPTTIPLYLFVVLFLISQCSPKISLDANRLWDQLHQPAAAASVSPPAPGTVRPVHR